MKFDTVDRAVRQTNCGLPFEFSPAAYAVKLSQARHISNRVSNRDGFDASDLSDDLEGDLGRHG